MQDENQFGVGMRYQREAYLRRMKCEIVLAILDGCDHAGAIGRLTAFSDVDLTEAYYLLSIFHVDFPAHRRSELSHSD